MAVLLHIIKIYLLPHFQILYMKTVHGKKSEIMMSGENSNTMKIICFRDPNLAKEKN